MGPTGCLLHKAILPSPGVISGLPNVEKQTQGGSQNEERKKHVPCKKEKNESLKKRTKKKMETVYQMQSSKHWL